MEETNFNLLEKKTCVKEIQAYRRRWIILVIFILYSAVNTFQWTEYSIIANVVGRYYEIGPSSVDWTSMVFMAVYPPFVIPVSYIIEKYGLRVSVLIGALGTMAGTTIKIFSVGPSLFWVLLLGQLILALAQMFIFCLSPRIAAVWFKAGEVSTACSLGVFGNLLGFAVCFLLTPILVKNHQDLEKIGTDLYRLTLGLSGTMAVLAVAVIFYFPEQPPKPPSVTQVKERNNKKDFTLKKFIGSIKELARNRAFWGHNLAYGILTGVFCCLITLLNQFVLNYFPNAQEDAGRMGLVMTVVGVLGSFIVGIFLDKTHKYKESAIFLYAMAAACLTCFIFALKMKSKLLAYISIGAVGFCSNGYFPVGFELAVELTYPVPEGSTAGILVAPSQALGVVFTLFVGWLNVSVGTFWAMSTLVVLLGIGTFITLLVPNILRRQEAFRQRLNKSNI